MPLVTVIKRYEREFRIPFYKLLKENLQVHGIDFELIIGQPNKYEVQNIKDALRDNPFGSFITNKYFYLGRNFLSYQNVFSHIKKSDLVILQQSNSELLNYVLLFKRNFNKNIKLALWGHGINFQAKNKDSIAQKFKLLLSNYVDHWFAYNNLTSDILAVNGYPRDKISVLNNTIDVTNERNMYDSITVSEINAIRLEYGIKEGDKVGIFCGSLYKLKRIGFLLEALKMIKQRSENFHFFILGKGEMENEVKAFEESNSQWFHAPGFKAGREKQLFLRISDFQLMPGSVGLNIIDSFYSQTPLVTILNSSHGPEILYLENKKNGLLVNDDLAEYVNSVVEIIGNDKKLYQLKEGCLESSKVYTIENMADNFYNGILQTLE